MNYANHVRRQRSYDGILHYKSLFIKLLACACWQSAHSLYSQGLGFIGEQLKEIPEHYFSQRDHTLVHRSVLKSLNF